MNYTLPDGKVVDIQDPSTMDPQQRANFNQIMQEHYPEFDIYEDQRSIGGQAYETIKGIPYGALNTGLSSIQGVISGIGIPDTNPIQEGLSNLREAIIKPYEPDPAYADKWLTKLGQGAGSFAAIGGAFKAFQPTINRHLSKSKFLNKTEGFGTGKNLFNPTK